MTRGPPQLPENKQNDQAVRSDLYSHANAPSVLSGTLAAVADGKAEYYGQGCRMRRPGGSWSTELTPCFGVRIKD